MISPSNLQATVTSAQQNAINRAALLKGVDQNIGERLLDEVRVLKKPTQHKENCRSSIVLVFGWTMLLDAREQRPRSKKQLSFLLSTRTCSVVFVSQSRESFYMALQETEKLCWPKLLLAIRNKCFSTSVRLRSRPNGSVTQRKRFEACSKLPEMLNRLLFSLVTSRTLDYYLNSISR